MTATEGSSRPEPARSPGRDPPPPKPKRSYTDVSIASAGAAYRVLLDGRPMMTPLRHTLETPSAPLADAIAAEWRAQGPELDPSTMPLTRLTSTALDRIAHERAAITDAVLGYVQTDLLCHRAPHPADLKARQVAQWQPVLDWLNDTHGIALTVVHGIVPSPQSATAVAAATRRVDALSIAELSAFQAAVAATGSFALGMALVDGRIDSAQAIAAADLDETYQNERWGEDADALVRRARIAAEIEAVGRYLGLIRA